MQGSDIDPRASRDACVGPLGRDYPASQGWACDQCHGSWRKIEGSDPRSTHGAKLAILRPHQPNRDWSAVSSSQRWPRRALARGKVRKDATNHCPLGLVNLAAPRSPFSTVFEADMVRGETEFECEREVQPRPKLGRWTAELNALLLERGNA